jgi:two-component system, NarL family, response regulator LiaR
MAAVSSFDELIARRDECRRRIEQLEAEIVGINRRLLGAASEEGLARRLTARQREVLEQLKMRRSNKEIAEALHVTVRTVKFHASALYAIFRVRGRRELELL